ncbi:glutathione S-transferase family protein [Microbulbifer sp. GL-2]|uniref:glutathione S-transferase family protein n=1 Tax=Microbulbifer sp. GL-2 TaxID=2591606 RepID=UPI001162FD9C|nr:glutathione S-transferase family protein [Microbulbifer sp. GL-2]BBM01949.1 hypothetical protein GL2_20230 [Microbulbifer sp. GL-2]
MAEIKLYGYSTSPYVRKIGCCLHYKKLPFEFVPVNPVDSKEISFTKQSQVPVLQIGDEWSTDSTPLAIWLDELYPEHPLFGDSKADRDKILELDSWVTNNLILGIFRTIYETEITAKFRHSAWRLAAIVSSQTPLSDEVRSAWPDLLKMAPFIQHMMADIDVSETLSEMQSRIALELIEHLGGGPFMGGLKQPSLVDFSVFPQLVFSYMVGIEQNLMGALAPALNNWINEVKAYLPKNPLLVPDYMIVNSLP